MAFFRVPRQVPFIIGNEACERFSFYGMRNVLTVFLADYLLREAVPDGEARASLATARFHEFMVGVYVFPLLGGWLADRYLGKFKTILWLSLVYSAGHACLALFDRSVPGFFFGLFLISLGSGGIKPCVSAMVGDQFDESSKAQAAKVFAAFYWSINLGSLFASLCIPLLLRYYGPAEAFGLPGVLMVLATVIFWAGQRYYVQVPPTGPQRSSFWKVLVQAVGQGWGAAEREHGAAGVEAVRAVLKVLLVFAPVPLFFALFDQKASTWVLQAKAMDPHFLGFTFAPSQMQFFNPALVMLLIPLTTGVLYPWLKRLGIPHEPPKRMAAGMFLAVLSWVLAGAVQTRLDAHETVNIGAQLGPYVLLTLGEVLVATTGLEFAYSQAPASMKGTLMSFWNLTIAVANLGVSQLATVLPFKGAPLFFFWAALAFVGALALSVIARGYVMVDRYRAAS
ncbi:MAG: MFS transporter [Myxococcaceae bacterium]|nr:MFS transporter [Myxococcaceae bacterium]